MMKQRRDVLAFDSIGLAFFAVACACAPSKTDGGDEGETEATGDGSGESDGSDPGTGTGADGGASTGTTSTSVDCASLDADECLANESCKQMLGDRWDNALNCTTRDLFAGCGAWEGCANAIYLMRDPDGNCWIFPDSCRPEGPGWETMQGCADDEPSDCTCDDVMNAPDCP